MRHRDQFCDRIDVARRGDTKARKLELGSPHAIGIVDIDLATEKSHLLATRNASGYPGLKITMSVSCGSGASSISGKMYLRVLTS